MNFKLVKTNFYDNEGNVPEFVDFNDEEIIYSEALENAKIELSDMFGKCNSYEDARKIIADNDNVFSYDKGYSTDANCTGRLYVEWMVVWGNDTEKTIYWDVRHY